MIEGGVTADGHPPGTARGGSDPGGDEMTTPDDEYRTLGLPPGARRKPAREPERDPLEEADRAGRTPSPGGLPPAGQAPPPTPPAPPPRRPEPPHASENFDTIAPPRAGIGRRGEAPAPAPAPPSEPPPAPGWGFMESAPPPAAEPFHPGWTMSEPVGHVNDPWGESAPTPAPPAPAVPAPVPPQPRVPASPPSPPSARYDSQVDTWEQDHASFPLPPGSISRPAPPASPLWAAPAGPVAAPAPPTRPPASRPSVDDGGNRTMGIDQVFPALKNPLLTLQFFNTNTNPPRWSDLGIVQGNCVDVGRSNFGGWKVDPETLAEKHVRLMIDEGALFIEPLPSVNGVYLKMKPNRPAELLPGLRFRIGRHVMAFRAPGPDAAEVTPLRSPEGEVFHSRVLRPLGFLDLLGPDGEAYMSHPLTKLGDPGTRIGREGARCDLALTGDDWVSGEHARVYVSGGKCWLEDKSRNGTFIQVVGMQKIEFGSAVRPDSGDTIAPAAT